MVEMGEWSDVWYKEGDENHWKVSIFESALTPAWGQGSTDCSVLLQMSYTRKKK